MQSEVNYDNASEVLPFPRRAAPLHEPAPASDKRFLHLLSPFAIPFVLLLAIGERLGIPFCCRIAANIQGNEKVFR